jgi:hypothetical protein
LQTQDNGGGVSEGVLVWAKLGIGGLFLVLRLPGVKERQKEIETNAESFTSKPPKDKNMARAYIKLSA